MGTSQPAAILLTRALFWVMLCSTINAKIAIVEDFEVTVGTEQAVTKTSDKFISITLDTETIVAHWRGFNPEDEAVLTLAQALYPSYLRVGGTTEDSLIFVDQQHTPEAFANVTFTANDWDRLNQFSQRSNLSLIFGLNSLYRPGLSWDPTNAIELMKYSAQKGYILDLELGNEPDIYPQEYRRNLDPLVLGRDFETLRNLMNTMPTFKSRQLLGPDVTSDSSPYGLRYLQKLTLRDKFSMDYELEYSGFMITGSGHINAMTFHHYYMNGKTSHTSDFVDVKILDSLKNSLKLAQQTIAYFSHGVFSRSFWLGETSSAYNGGVPGVSDTFVAGFMWLDKLGLSALYGADVVIRQAFVGGNYGLVENINGVYRPNPDYWLTVLFKNLVGETVLQTQGSDEKLRIYSHCANTRAGYGFGSVTFYMMNLYNTTRTLAFSQFAFEKELHLYTLSSADPRSLVSRSVLLNGKPLELSSGQLPPFTPIVQNSTTVNIAPFTMMFVVVPGGNATACTS